MLNFSIWLSPYKIIIAQVKHVYNENAIFYWKWLPLLNCSPLSMAHWLSQPRLWYRFSHVAYILAVPSPVICFFEIIRINISFIWVPLPCWLLSLLMWLLLFPLPSLNLMWTLRLKSSSNPCCNALNGQTFLDSPLLWTLTGTSNMYYTI